MAESEAEDWVLVWVKDKRSRNDYFLPVGANLPPRLIPSLLLLIQPLDFIFLQNPTCAQHYDDKRFFILAQGCSSFHLSALEATFIKTSTPPSAGKRICVQLKELCTDDALSLFFFQPITARLCPISIRSFSCSLHSDDSFWQVSDEKLRRYVRFNQEGIIAFKHRWAQVR